MKKTVLLLAIFINCSLQYKKKANVAFVSYLLRIRSPINIQNDSSTTSTNPTSSPVSTNVIFSNLSGFITDESGGNSTFTVKLSNAPSANVTLNFVSSNALEGITNPATATFTTSNWNIPQTITILGQNDALLDGIKSYTIQINSISNDKNYNSLNLPILNVTNLDNDKYTFATQSVTKGSFSGVSGADSLCNSDANKPSVLPNVYKAFIVDGASRMAATLGDATGVSIGSQADWVLNPNATYFRPDGLTPLFTTNSSRLFDLNTAVQNPFDPTVAYYWTGISSDWTSGQNCNSWTNQTGAFGGHAGDGTTAGVGSASSTAGLCNSNIKLFCIQQ